MTEQTSKNYEWSIISEHLDYERHCYKRSDGYEQISWRYCQYVQFEFIDEANTAQTVYGYYDDGIAALYTVDPKTIDWNSDAPYEPDYAGGLAWRGNIFPADNLHNGDSDFYHWDTAEIFDAIVRLYDINMLLRRVPKSGVLNSDI